MPLVKKDKKGKYSTSDNHLARVCAVITAL